MTPDDLQRGGAILAVFASALAACAVPRPLPVQPRPDCPPEVPARCAACPACPLPLETELRRPHLRAPPVEPEAVETHPDCPPRFLRCLEPREAVDLDAYMGAARTWMREALHAR